jgi:glycosyltransferase involved in cell wall biosynthesis
MHESVTAFGKDPNPGTPTVSVGIPVYNGAKFLESALDSLLSQTFSDIEIIISDNASNDRTQEICQRYAARDGRVRYFRHDRNQGAAWNFCEVYKLSVGRYFKWAAADDICAPTYIERCVDVLQRDPTVVCCHSRTCKIDRDGNPLEHLPDPTMVMSRFPKRLMNGSSRYTARRFLDVLLTTGWGARCFGVIRSEALRNSQLILPTFGSEKVLMAELSLIGRYHDLPETLWYQRVHVDASSLLKTAAARGKFIAGSSSSGANPRLQLLQGHFEAVRRSKLSPLNRLLCLFALGRYLVQPDKWLRILAGKLSAAPAVRAHELRG